MDRRVLLLTHPSAALRFLVLTRLYGAGPADEEVRETTALRAADPYVQGLFARQKPDGSFDGLPQGSTLGGHLTTAYALSILGYLGFTTDDRRVEVAAGYLLSLQQDAGSWPLLRNRRQEAGYDMIPLQTAIPLRGLCAVGLAENPEVERATKWLLDKQLPDGAWPTGRAGGSPGYVGGYRRLPHSRWGCRSNTTAAVSALADNPRYRERAETRAGLDHLLSRETDDAAQVGFEAARLAGYQQVTGFITHHAAFDAAHILSLAARCGAGTEDGRLAALVDRFSHPESTLLPCAIHAAARHWLTYDVELSLTQLSGSWRGTEIHTPYRSYPQDPRRF